MAVQQKAGPSSAAEYSVDFTPSTMKHHANPWSQNSSAVNSAEKIDTIAANAHMGGIFADNRISMASADNLQMQAKKLDVKDNIEQAYSG